MKEIDDIITHCKQVTGYLAKLSVTHKIMMLDSYTVKNVVVVNLYQSVIVNCKLDAGLYIVLVPRKYLSPIFELFPPHPDVSY